MRNIIVTRTSRQSSASGTHACGDPVGRFRDAFRWLVLDPVADEERTVRVLDAPAEFGDVGAQAIF
jgi:hypothetical protein